MLAVPQHDAAPEVVGYDRGFRLLAGYAAFLALADVLTIAFGLAHIRMTRLLGFAVLAASAAGGFGYMRRIPRRAPAHEAPLRFARVLAWGVAVTAGVVYVVSWISAFAKPDFSWDGNTYHIPTIHFWALKGYVHWITFDHDIGPGWSWAIFWMSNSYPKGVETFSFLLSAAAGSSHPVNTCNLWFLPLGVLGLFVLARRLGASFHASLATSLAFSLVPVVVAQGMTTYVDAALGCAVIASLACVAEVLFRIREDAAPWPVAPAAGAAFGLAAAAKASGLASVLLSCAVLAFVGAWLAWRSAGRRLAVLARQASFLGAVAAVTAVVAGYWYARDWWFAGNPLAPVRVAVLGHEIFPGVSVSNAISEEGLTDPVLLPLSKIGRAAYTWRQGWPVDYPASIRFYDSHLGGLGFLWLLACVPAIVFLLARDVRRGVRARGAAVHGGVPPLVVFPAVLAILAVAWWVQPMDWWARYTMWIYAAGLPALALLIDATRGARMAVMIPARAWIGVTLVLAAKEAFFTFGHSGMADGFLDRPRVISYTPSGIWRALTNYAHPNYLYEQMSAMDRAALTSDQPVGVCIMSLGGGPLIGQLSMPVGGRDLVPIAEATFADENKLREIVERKHIRWLFWRDDWKVPDAIRQLAHGEDHTPGLWWTFDVGAPGALARHDVRAK